MSHDSVCSRPSMKNDSAFEEREVHLPPWPLPAEAPSRRNRVYENLMKAWREAGFAAVPKPRSTHPRQAPSPRQRGYFFSGVSTGNLNSSWGGLKSTISTPARSAWEEQLQRRNLCRLAGVPTSILLRQGEHLAEGYRVFAVAPEMTVEDTARMVVEGLCPMPPPFDSDRTHQPPRFAGRAENAERVISEASTTGFGDGETARRSGSTLAFLHDESHNEWSAQERLRGDEYPQHEPRMTRVEDTEGDAGGYVGGRHPSPPIAVPSRGFHLINLHAVVRNSIEWSRSLPKVAPCFRVCDNRDSVLLGLMHALGGRLTCSSAEDLSAASKAASPGAGSVSSLPLRLLDRHVCRSPAMLRASVATGVRLFEVDCAEEIHRIAEALSKASKSRLEGLPSRPETKMGPAEIIVRLAVPSQSKRKPSDGISSTTTSGVVGTLEAVYGAAVEDVVGIVRAAAETRCLKSNHCCECAVNIVGFSIDVGTASWNDALTAASLASAGDPCTPSTGIAAEEAVASGVLARDFDAAVAFAVEAARLATDCVSARKSSVRGPGDEGAGALASRAGKSGSASTLSPPPFSFRRLHVTGLGEGGARQEPLALLKSSLSRHLPATGRGVGRPVLVSADATEHVMAGGVWSTVSAVIGRKCLTPDGASQASDGGGCSPGEAKVTGSTMYYIDDGCYGSLSGVLLRGVQMYPSHLLRGKRDVGDLFSPSVAAKDFVAGEGATPGLVPCTVWGPTCCGLDCVSRVTPLPVDIEPGRDWLLFTDVGIRGSADSTDFNGIRPLDCFYCVSQPEGNVAAPPKPSARPPLTAQPQIESPFSGVQNWRGSRLST